MTTATKDFTLTFLVDQTPEEVFDAINDIRAWWSEDFRGTSHKLNDEFEVRFGDVHYSRHKLTEVAPGKKIVWLVTDSCLNFLNHKTEWTGTQMIFDISKSGGQTMLHFTHVGLQPEIECYGSCTKGWKQYLADSLIPFITSGQGNPNVLTEDIEAKSNQK